MKNKFTVVRVFLWTTIISIGASGTAFSHVTLAKKHAIAGSTLKNALQIGHGCTDDSGAVLSTKRMIMDVPDGVRGVTAYAKPGWKINIIKGAVTPYELRGKIITEDTVKVMWTAMTDKFEVPDGIRDEFWFRASLPDKAAMSVYFPTIQVCGPTDKQRWIEIPNDSQEPSDLTKPAPRLVTTPSRL